MEKLYPFSAKKHIHDLSFRSDRAKNLASDILSKGKDTRGADSLLDLAQRLDDIIIQAAGGVPVIWLSGKDYRIAVESVAWAAEQRGRSGK